MNWSDMVMQVNAVGDLACDDDQLGVVLNSVFSGYYV